MPPERKPVIVSLTPLPLSADSRTLKQVTSVHRFGFRSIVIEGSASLFEAETVPFEIIPVRPKESTAGPSTMASRGEGENAAPSVVLETGAIHAYETASSASTTVAKDAGKNHDYAGRVDFGNLSKLSRSSLARFAIRYIPGAAKAACVFRSCLGRAIVDEGALSQQVSTKEVIRALPRAVLLFTIAVVKFLTLAGVRRIGRLMIEKRNSTVSFAAEPLAFARHLGRYVHEHFLPVFSVTPRADLYYLHAFYEFPAVWILCRMHGAKFIYDAHDFYLHQLNDPSVSAYWKKWVIPFERIIERACVRSAASVVTVNEGIASLMRNQFGCEPLILRNAHDYRLDRPPARTIRETIGLSSDAFLVVSIGNYKSGTVLDPMLDALAALPNHVHLAFIGGRYPELGVAAASRGIEGRVHLMGRVLPQEVVPFAASADAAILLYCGLTPNFSNALPNGLFQSIAAELPLIYPNLDQISRLAEHYEFGIMANPQNAAEIERALRVLLEDGERRAAIRRKLRVAGRELCWEREEQVLKRLLDLHLRKEEISASMLKD